MNGHNLNGALINGANLDVTQRSVILAYGVAYLGATGGRVLRRGPVEVSGEVTVSPAGRVFAKSAIRAFGQAYITRALTPTVYTCHARSVVTPRTRTRCVLSVTAEAQMPGVLTAWRRAPVTPTGEALATGLGDVKPLTDVLSPVTCFAMADIAAQYHIEGTLPVTASAQAAISIAPHLRRRSPVAASAQAYIYAIGTEFRRIPWDEPAPDERTFRVPAIQTTFYAR